MRPSLSLWMFLCSAVLHLTLFSMCGSAAGVFGAGSDAITIADSEFSAAGDFGFPDAGIAPVAESPPIPEPLVLTPAVRASDERLSARMIRKLRRAKDKVKQFFKKRKNEFTAVAISMPAGLAIGYLVAFLFGGVPILGVIAGSIIGDQIYRQTLAWMRRKQKGEHWEKPRDIHELVIFLKNYARDNSKTMLIAAVVGLFGFFVGAALVGILSPLFDALLRGLSGAWKGLAMILARLLQIGQPRLSSPAINALPAAPKSLLRGISERMLRMFTGFSTSHSLKTMVFLPPAAVPK